MGTRLSVLCPGALTYGEAYGLQQRTAAAVSGGANPTLILLEHPPTFTFGARAEKANLGASREHLTALGAEVVSTDRGGDVTFHGPGQVVGYGIIDLRKLGIGVSDYVYGLEQILIEAIASFGLEGVRSSLGRGVWVSSAKIAAIGIRVSRGVTTHGFALNVSTDLSWFDHIVPCGLPNVCVTSMSEVTGRTIRLMDVQEVLIGAFASQFNLTADALVGAYA